MCSAIKALGVTKVFTKTDFKQVSFFFFFSFSFSVPSLTKYYVLGSGHNIQDNQGKFTAFIEVKQKIIAFNEEGSW